ncbi:unnamed protein product [Calypogeia fissa]
MALEGCLSAIEGTNGNYEPMNGRLGGCPGTFGSGTFSQSLMEPQLSDADSRVSPFVKGLQDVIIALDNVDKICMAMIEKYKTPEGPGSSQSAVSQCSTEKTASKNSHFATGADNLMEKKREKCAPREGAPNFIDLTSEGSCDTGTSRRPDKEDPEDAGQVQSSPVATSMIPITISDDEDDLNESGGPSSQPHPIDAAPPPKVISPAPPAPAMHATPLAGVFNTVLPPKVDDRAAPEVEVCGNADPLCHVWGYMQHVKENTEGANRGGVQEGVQEPTLPQVPEISNSVKRRKFSNGVNVPHNINYNQQPTQWAQDGNELMQVEPNSVPTAKRGRGRPRKEDSIRREDLSQDGCRDLLDYYNGNVTQRPQVDVVHVNTNQFKEKKAGKGEQVRNVKQTEKKGKRKVDIEDIVEDEVDEEEEESGEPEVRDVVEDLLKQSLKSSKEKVDYEPYVRRKYLEEEDELEDVFMEMKTHKTSTSGPSSDMATEPCGKDEGLCDHKNFDFEEGVGFYCEDCGSVGIEMPTSESSQQNKSGCAHKNYEFTDEAGIYCPDCGKVFRDIQSYYIASDRPKALRKQGQKVQDTGDDLPRVQLNLQGLNCTEDFHGADLQLHPRFEETMHPHQKTGFKFLADHLLGGQQPNSEAMGCVLAHAPGTGKTCLMISFVQSFLAKFPNGKPLILAPKIMLETWETEFQRWQVQEVKIFRLNAFSYGSSRGDGGYEDDDDEEYTRPSPPAPPQMKNNWKENRALQLEEWQKSRGVLLMSYKMFTNLVMNGLGENVLPDSLDYQMSKVILEATNLVILDEGHQARNDHALLTKALLAMKTKRKVVLSGTLFHNTFKELYTVLKLCRDDFMIAHPEYGKRIAELATDKCSRGTPCLQRSDKEIMMIEQRLFTDEIGEKLERYVKDASNVDDIGRVVLKLKSLTKFVDWYPGWILKSLPGLCEYYVYLNLTDDQEDAIKLIPNKNHMTRQVAILQACIHPSFVARADPLSVLKVGVSSLKDEAHKGVKITFLLRLMANCKMQNEKLLIFCSTLEPLKYVEELFCNIFSWQYGQQILRLDGKMQDSDRQRVIVEFNKEKSQSQVLLASTKACKEGISLVGASRVVVLDCPDNPAVVRQAVSRAFRIGQKKKVVVYRLVTSNEEETTIFRRSVKKERLSQVIADTASTDSASTIGRLAGFLQEQSIGEVEDQVLKKMMHNDRVDGNRINVVYKYNAVG